MRNILISVPGKKEKLPLSVTHPELAREADGWDPSDFMYGSHRKLSWKCSNNHKWQAAIRDRAAGKGCRQCYLDSPRKVRSLSDENPVLAKGADLSNSNIAGKFDGYSEAWSKSTFGAKSIKELMRLTEEYEEF